MLAVVEVCAHITDNLVSLMTFPGHQHHIAGLGAGYGFFDSFGTVDNHIDIVNPVPGHAGEHLIDDVNGFFVSGVVGSEYKF